MNKFAFLVHPRHSAREDMAKVSPFFLLLPEFLLRKIITFLPPIKAGKVRFSNKKDDVVGWIIWVPLLGEQMLELPREVVINKILQAIKMVKKDGVKIIGLGEFTASVTHGGSDLVGKVQGVHITSGNSLTAGVVFRAIKKIVNTKKISVEEAKIAVVGAAGSIGRGVSSLLAQEGFKLLLIDREKKINRIKKDFYFLSNIDFDISISSIINSDVIVVATSSMEQLIQPSYLKKMAIVYDITQPRNTSPDLIKERPDITVIDGGLVDTPFIDFGVDIGLKKNQAYACLAETVLLALENSDKDYTGYTNIELSKQMLLIMDKYPEHFRINVHESFGKKLNNDLTFSE